MDPVMGTTESVFPKSLAPGRGWRVHCSRVPQTRHPDRQDTLECDPPEPFRSHPRTEEERASRWADSRHLFLALWSTTSTGIRTSCHKIATRQRLRQDGKSVPRSSY